MIRVRSLGRLSRTDYARLVSGYVSDTSYEVRHSDGPSGVTFALRRRRRSAPFRKRFPHTAEELARYRKAIRLGWSLGAFDGKSLVGILLAEPHAWNHSVWVLEVGVAPAHRRRGTGRRLFEALVERARRAGYRTIVCETQTTNGPAIAFYRSLGFAVEGVDISYYTNQDLERGEVAIFMKKRVPARTGARAPSTRRRRASEPR